MPTLLDHFSYSFMQHALLAAVLVGITCASLGAYVVLRRMAFVGDAMAHTAMPGLVVAYVNGWTLFAGALVADVLTALGIAAIARRRGVREDTAIGILFTGMFALGVVLMPRRTFADITGMLLGNILSLDSSDLWRMAVVGALVLLTLFLLHKELELTSFDPGYAEVIGLRTAVVRLVLLLLLAVTVVVGIQAVGVVLTSALLVTPAATASLLTRRLTAMMILACAFAVASGVIGLCLAAILNLRSGGAGIVLVCTALFAVVYVGRAVAGKLGMKSKKRTEVAPAGI